MGTKNFDPNLADKFQQRKFLVVPKKKKKNKNSEDEGTSFCNCKEKNNKCLCVAYENLRKSQQLFSKNHGIEVEEMEEKEGGDHGVSETKRLLIEEEKERLIIKEDAKEESAVAQSWYMKVMNFLKAFGKCFCLCFSNEENEEPHQQNNSNNEKGSCSSFVPPDKFVLTSENLGFDYSQPSLSSTSKKKKKKKQKPSKLRIEENGKMEGTNFKEDTRGDDDLRREAGDLLMLANQRA